MKFLAFGLIFVGCCWVLSGCDGDSVKQKIILLEDQQIVADYAKITVTPYPYRLRSSFKLRVLMESFQNQELLSTDLLATAVLEDQDKNLYIPRKWVIIKKEDYQVLGDLIFYPLSKNITEIHLKLFQVGDNNTFVWRLK